MSTFIEYKLEDGLTILVEDTEDRETGIRPTSNRASNTIVQASQTFENALSNIKKSAAIMRSTFESLRADEVEVSFGLKTTGELGNFAIGKVGIEANYIVKLKWNNYPEANKT